MFEIRPPRTGDEIATEFARVADEITAFFQAIDAETFLTAQGEKWSPADHLRHLTKSIRPLAKGLGLPGPIIGLRFGWPRRASRTFDELYEAYTTRLAQGVSAGRFAPSSPSTPGEGDAGKTRILESWQGAQRAMRAVIPRWSERKLDRYQVPHPALGKLTMREMLYFTIFHNAHHARLVAARLKEG